jgi:hypothetical protein
VFFLFLDQNNLNPKPTTPFLSLICFYKFEQYPPTISMQRMKKLK